MPERSVTHSSFVLERSYTASPARVFAAWADPAAKARWFNGPDEWGPDEHQIDFRVGGRETSRGGPVGGPVHTFECFYHDIVPEQRIVYCYDMYVDRQRISVSLATVELIAQGAGTRLVFTEQATFLEGADTPAQREKGTSDLLDALGEQLRREATDG